MILEKKLIGKKLYVQTNRGGTLQNIPSFEYVPWYAQILFMMYDFYIKPLTIKEIENLSEKYGARKWG